MQSTSFYKSLSLGQISIKSFKRPVSKYPIKIFIRRATQRINCSESKCIYVRRFQWNSFVTFARRNVSMAVILGFASPHIGHRIQFVLCNSFTHLIPIIWHQRAACFTCHLFTEFFFSFCSQVFSKQMDANAIKRTSYCVVLRSMYSYVFVWSALPLRFRFNRSDDVAVCFSFPSFFPHNC